MLTIQVPARYKAFLDQVAVFVTVALAIATMMFLNGCSSRASHPQLLLETGLYAALGLATYHLVVAYLVEFRAAPA